MLPDSSTLNHVMGSRKSSGELRYYNENEDGEDEVDSRAQLGFIST